MFVIFVTNRVQVVCWGRVLFGTVVLQLVFAFYSVFILLFADKQLLQLAEQKSI